MAAETKRPERPLSPHLQVYKPQLTSVLSITHRLTGIALAVGTLLLVWWIAAVAAGPEALGTVNAFMGSWLGIFLLAGWSFSLFYHLLNGIRHLFWDIGAGLELKAAYTTGWLVVAGSLVLTAVTWVMALGMVGG